MLLEGSPATVHVSGVGKDKSKQRIEALLRSSKRPDAILSLGFARALVEDLRTGDLVLADKLHSSDDPVVLESDGALLNLAKKSLEQPGLPRYFVAGSLTVTQAVLTSHEREQHTTDAAWIANMEDYWVAKEAIQQGIPFLSVRAVLDTRHQQIPAFAAGLGHHGKIMQPILALPNVMLRPWSVGALLRLSRQADIAEKSLAAFGLPFVSRLKELGSNAISGRMLDSHSTSALSF